jgi:hypothetical protein
MGLVQNWGCKCVPDIIAPVVGPGGRGVRWILTLAVSGDEGACVDIMEISKAGDLSDIANLGLTLTKAKQLLARVQREIYTAQARAHAVERPVATPGLNGRPGVAGSYGLYLTMQTQTKAVGPPTAYEYLSGQVALMLDPGDNDGAASSTPTGFTFANTGPTGTVDDTTLATGTLVSGRYTLNPAPGIRSIGDFLQTFRPAAGEGGFFVTSVLPFDGTVQRLGGPRRFANDRRDLTPGAKGRPLAKITPNLRTPPSGDRVGHIASVPIPLVSGQSQGAGA